MATSYNVRGLVLKSYPLGEKDRILVLFTRERGKLRAVAKGARRPGGRFAALEPLVEIEAALHPGKNLHTITQAQITDSHRRLRERLDTLAYGLFMAELIDLFTVDLQVAEEDYQLLRSALVHLETGAGDTVLAYFLIHLLRQMGLLPSFNTCCRCQTTEQDMVALNAPQGGLLCAECARITGGIALDSETVMLLGFFSQVSWEGFAAVDADSISPKLTKALEQFVFHQLSGRPRSYEFLSSMRRV